MKVFQYVLLLPILLIASGSNLGVYDLSLCHVSYVNFYLPAAVSAGQSSTITTDVYVYSCVIAPQQVRVDLYGAGHTLLSTGSSWSNVFVYGSNGLGVNVTNTIIAPQTVGAYLITAFIYVLAPDGVALGSYQSSFALLVGYTSETTTTLLSQSSLETTTAQPAQTMTETVSTTILSVTTVSSLTAPIQTTGTVTMGVDPILASLALLCTALFIALVLLLKQRRPKS